MNKIPKIIHYCWFGEGPLLEHAKKCIKSWERICSDYRIIEWNEQNFDINCCAYVKEAYEKKKWAFVSDYARFVALRDYGGIYFDTDIEVLKSFDPLLFNGAFFGFGRQSLTLPVFGATANHPFIEDVIDIYKQRHFILENGEYDMTTIELTAQKALEKYGFDISAGGGETQYLESDIVIYPTSYFSSTDWATGIISRNKELFVIHYAEGSWMNKDQRLFYGIRRRTIKLFGERLGIVIGNGLYILRKDGMKAFFNKIIEKIQGD